MQKTGNRHIILFLSGIVLCLCGIGCKNRDYRPMAEYSGYAIGSSYHIVCDSGGTDLAQQIDGMLGEIDRSISLWDSLSLISRFNRSTSGIYVDAHFASVLQTSKRIHAETEGAFNPAVYPLMKLWGLDKNAVKADSIFKKRVVPDSILKFTRFEDINIGAAKDSTGKSAHFVSKRYPQNSLDFNGLSAGYAVDAICTLLDSKGIRNYRVEVGQEMRTKGVDANQKPWLVGIDKPTGAGETRVVESIIPLGNRAFSTSGNYRRYYEKDGKRLSYRIDPQTGKPAEHTLLCTSVFAPTAVEADAYATAFMAMGPGRTTQFLARHPNLWAYLISSGFDQDYQTWISPDLEKEIETNK